MRRCKRCNKIISDSALTCPTCGATAEDVPEKATPQPTAPARAKSAEKRPAEPAFEPVKARRADGVKAAAKRKKAAPKPLTLVLLIAAVAIVIAIILVLAKRCGASAADAAGASAPVQAAAAAQAGSGETRIEAPSVVGLQLEDATAQMSALGLAVDTIAAAFDPAFADGAVLAQSVEEGALLMKGDHVTLSVNTLPLSLEVLQISPRAARVTLSNILEVCRSMDTTNPNFDFKIVIHAVEEYELTGGFRCLVGSNEETPLSRVNTQLLREGTLVKGFESAVAYEDSIAWMFTLDDWMGFHFDNVSGYEVSLDSRVEASSGVRKTFLPDQVRSMAIVDSVFTGGSVRVDVPAADALTVRITDDALPAGYLNSPTPGGARPKWDVKLVVNSYLWLSATVDGTGGEPLSGMRATGGLFAGKDSKAKSFDGVSYTVEGNVMVVSVPIPKDIGFDPYELTWMELATGDGAYTKKIKIR